MHVYCWSSISTCNTVELRWQEFDDLSKSHPPLSTTSLPVCLLCPITINAKQSMSVFSIYLYKINIYWQVLGWIYIYMTYISMCNAFWTYMLIFEVVANSNRSYILTYGNTFHIWKCNKYFYCMEDPAVLLHTEHIIAAKGHPWTPFWSWKNKWDILKSCGFHGHELTIANAHQVRHLEQGLWLANCVNIKSALV